MAVDWVNVHKWSGCDRQWLLTNSACFEDLVNLAMPTRADGVYFLRQLGEHGCWLQTESSSYRKGPDITEMGRFIHESDYFEIRMLCAEIEIGLVESML